MFRPVLVALLAALVLAAPAQAGIAVPTFSVTPSTTAAGGHPNVTITTGFSYSPSSDDVRNVTVSLPPGLVGNPSAAPHCTTTQLNADNCPAASKVGTVSVTADAGFSLTSDGDVYLVDPTGSEPARLGIVARPLGGVVISSIVLSGPITLRVPGDGGLDTTFTDLPRAGQLLGFIPVDITVQSMTLTLNGMVGGNAFLTNPTTCDTATSRVAATSYDGGSATASSSFTPTDCAGVPFTPSLDVSLAPAARDTPAGVTVALTQPDPGAGRAQSNVRRADVTLPPGVVLNPAVADGAEACTDAQLDTSSGAAAGCPAASQVGTTLVKTPLLPDIAGKVFLGAPTADAPLRTFVDLPVGDKHVKLVAGVTLDPATGRVRSVFDGLPQIPFTRFELAFRGGDKSVFLAPETCGPATAEAALTPYSGGAAATPTSTVIVSDDGAGAACPAPAPFAPGFAASVDTTQAAAPTTMRLAISRPDRSARIGTLSLSLPAGLAPKLSGVGFCPPADVDTGTCGADSRLGSVRAVSGSGPATVALDGAIHLTTGTGGAPAAMAIIIPAKVGPFDLGTVVSRANVRVRPDAGLDVESPLPQILGGIPLGVRYLALTLDRPGFTANATSCDPKQFVATLTAVDGRAVTQTAPYQPTGCSGLPFAPRVAARATLHAGGGPDLNTVITQGPGEANARSVTVTLPKQFAPNLFAIRRACPQDQFDAGACPAAATIGKATANTSLLPVGLSGPVRLVAPKSGLPQLVADLEGPISIRLVGTVGLGATTTTKFEGIPDVPLSSFELQLDGGKDSLLSVDGDPCAKAPTLGAAFTSHAGGSLSRSVPVAVSGCSPSVKASVRRASSTKPAVRLLLRPRGAAGARMSAVKIGLPKGLKLNKKRAKLVKVRADGKTVSRKAVRVSSSKLLIKLGKGGAAQLDIRADRGAVRIASKLRRQVKRKKKAPKLSFAVRIADVSGAKTSSKQTLRPKR